MTACSSNIARPLVQATIQIVSSSYRRDISGGEFQNAPQTETNMQKMSILCKDLSDSAFLHHDHRGQVGKGNRGLVGVALAQLPCGSEPVVRDPFEDDASLRDEA